jgi:hypothetical protein
MKDEVVTISKEYAKHREIAEPLYRQEYAHYFKDEIFIMPHDEFHKQIYGKAIWDLVDSK